MIVFASLATGCAYHERVAAVPPPPVVIGSTNVSAMGLGTRVIINLSEHGCVRMPKDLAERFFERVHIRTPVKVEGNAQDLTSVRIAIPLFY